MESARIPSSRQIDGEAESLGGRVGRASRRSPGRAGSASSGEASLAHASGFYGDSWEHEIGRRERVLRCRLEDTSDLDWALAGKGRIGSATLDRASLAHASGFEDRPLTKGKRPAIIEERRLEPVRKPNFGELRGSAGASRPGLFLPISIHFMPGECRP